MAFQTTFNPNAYETEEIQSPNMKYQMYNGQGANAEATSLNSVT